MSKKILAAAALGSLGLSLAAHADTQVTEKTSVGGKAYVDLTSVDATTYSNGVGTKSAANGIGLDLTRFYLSVDHTFDETWSANLTTDVQYISAAPSSGTSAIKTTELFVKKAYLQGKFDDAFTLRVGSTDLPWIPFEEGVYGYRWVEKTVIDRLGYGTSADWGVHALGKFGTEGMMQYAVAAVNGNGYKNPTRSKTLDWEGRLSITPVKGLVLAAGGYSGKLGNDVQNASTYNTASRYEVLASYAVAGFKVTGVYFNAENYKTVTSATAQDKVDGFSIYADYKFTPKVAGFLRYDDTTANANKNVAATPDVKDTYYNAGVAFNVRKGVDLAAVYKHDEVKTGGNKSSDRDEIGVFAQVAF